MVSSSSMPARDPRCQLSMSTLPMSTLSMPTLSMSTLDVNTLDVNTLDVNTLNVNTLDVNTGCLQSHTLSPLSTNNPNPALTPTRPQCIPAPDPPQQTTRQNNTNTNRTNNNNTKQPPKQLSEHKQDTRGPASFCAASSARPRRPSSTRSNRRNRARFSGEGSRSYSLIASFTCSTNTAKVR